MKKLRVKVFVIIFSIFSLVILSVIFITNMRNYYGQKREIQDILNRHTIDDKDIQNFKDNKEPNNFNWAPWLCS